jgi:hypothetical protein
MLVRHLSRSFQLELYNEDNPEAFEKWRLREFSEVRKLVEQSYARVVLFKPILDTYRSNLLLTEFPESRLVFAFRHFDDVINSSLKRFGVLNRLNHVRSWIEDDFAEFAALSPPEDLKAYIRARWRPEHNPQTGAALYWLFQNLLYFHLNLDTNERVRLGCYEAVVTNPEPELRSLTEFLGFQYEPKISEGIFSSSINRNPEPEIDMAIRADCEELWRDLYQRAMAQC